MVCNSSELNLSDFQEPNQKYGGKWENKCMYKKSSGFKIIIYIKKLM